MIEANLDYDTCVQRMAQLRSEIIGFAALETLKYVARSGRVSNLQAGIGDLLQVKPILELWEGGANCVLPASAGARSPFRK